MVPPCPGHQTKAIAAPSITEGEIFDFTGLESDSNREVSPISPSATDANPAPKSTHANRIPETMVTVVAPITKPLIKSNRAADVDLIFDCACGKKSVCKYCR